MVQKEQVNVGLSDLFSGIIGAALTILAAFIGWLTMVARMRQRLEDHIKADDERFDAFEKRLEREHTENRETLREIRDDQREANKKLDRLIERTAGGGR